MTKISKGDIEQFVGGWVSGNMNNVPGLENLLVEVGRLAAQLTGDARANGISGSDLHKTFGDIDDYLANEYEKRLR